MKLVRFMNRDDPRYGTLDNGRIEMIAGDPFDGVELSGVSISFEKAKLLAPSAPSKVIAVGLNYRDHAAELKMDLPAEPVLFLKPPSSVIGPDDQIIYPAGVEQVDYEAELGIVIGKTASHVAPDKVKEHILGYTCANDITARDLQQRDGQWTRAKSFDTFCPLGPHIETDLDATDLSVRLVKNGDVKQHSSTAQMVYNVFELVCFISQVMTLCPGDVILTGTPPGVGPVEIGDLVEVQVEGIGTLSNRIA